MLTSTRIYTTQVSFVSVSQGYIHAANKSLLPMSHPAIKYFPPHFAKHEQYWRKLQIIRLKKIYTAHNVRHGLRIKTLLNAFGKTYLKTLYQFRHVCMWQGLSISTKLGIGDYTKTCWEIFILVHYGPLYRSVYLRPKWKCLFKTLIKTVTELNWGLCKTYGILQRPSINSLLFILRTYKKRNRLNELLRHLESSDRW